MKKSHKILFTVFALLCACACFADAIKVACVGDSITYGAYLQPRELQCYPAQLAKILSGGYEVRNFGVNGRTALSKGDYPYVQTAQYRDALNFKPGIVVIGLGTNDSKSQNMAHIADFERDLSDIARSFAKLDSKPKIYLCIPMPAFCSGKQIDAERVRREIIPRVRKVAESLGIETIDLYSRFDGKGDLFPDKIHPNAEGAKLMAEIVAKKIAK